MNTFALALVALFWLPIAIVTIYDLFWDTHFWQRKEYRFDRLVHQLRWDFALSHRRPIYTSVKIILLILLLTFAVFPGTYLPLLAVVIAYALWINEAFNVFEKLLNHSFPYLEPTFRNIVILATGIITLGVLPVMISLYLLAVNPPEVSLASTVLIPSMTAGGTAILPLAYIYLVFSTLLGLAYDLGSPLITTLLVLITSPLAWLEQQFLVVFAKLFLRQYPNLMIIAITGSQGKTTTKQLLEHLLMTKYKIASTDHTETSLHRLAISIITNLKPDTQVFIADLNAYTKGQMDAMAQLLNPQIVVFTGIDHNRVALFGGLDNTLAVSSEILEHLQPRSTVIYNGDDSLVTSIAQNDNHKEVFYYAHHDPHKDMKDNKLEVNSYYIRNSRISGRKIEFEVRNQSQKIKLSAPAESKEIISSLLGAIAAANEAGIDMGSIVKALDQLPSDLHSPELIAGDNYTLLVNESRALTLKGFEHLLGFMATTPAPRRILITTGIHELGKYKTDVYGKLRDKIQAAADVVITYDKHLLDSLRANNNKLVLIQVTHLDELIYNVREQSTQGSVILLAGPLDPGIVTALRSE
jgi:UDP-N-acetylmuramyl pentapeptide synthase